MKDAQFNREPINAKFRLPEPMNMPILSADPTIISHPLHPNDSFLIFASDGLWEHLSNEKAVEIVHKNPHAVSFVGYFLIALINFAMTLASPFSYLSLCSYVIILSLSRHL